MWDVSALLAVSFAWNKVEGLSGALHCCNAFCCPSVVWELIEASS